MKGMFKKKKAASSEMALQITSMADIFTLILVFLLKSSASGESSVSPSTAISLPVASGVDITREVLKLEINKGTILVDQKNILQLNNFDFPVSEVQVNGASQTLYKALLDQRKLRGDSNFASDLLVLADESTPYSTLKIAMASSAAAGFVDLELVVVDNE